MTDAVGAEPSPLSPWVRWIAAVIATVFTVLFAVTFFARDHITDLAEDYVVEKTVEIADAAVALAADHVRNPTVQKMVSEEVLQTVEAELAAYRRDPRAYVADLVEREASPDGAVGADLAASVRERVLGWRTAARNHFQRTMDALLRDLRIFAGTNVVAAFLAFLLASRSSPRPDARASRVLHHLLWGTDVLLLGATVYATWMYVDSLSYFRILCNSYMGWWYPETLAGMFLLMWSHL